MESIRRDAAGSRRVDAWEHWPVNWTAVWVGALAAFATALIIGLIGIALGVETLGAVSPGTLGIGTLILGVLGAFVAFVVGGWVAGEISGIRRSEPAMLQGAIVWLVAVPLLMGFAAFGAGHYFGGWFAGLAGTPSWAVNPNATVDPNAAAMARNSVLGAMTALLIGLVGSVIGGWMASREPMTFTHYRTRDHEDSRRAA